MDSLTEASRIAAGFVNEGGSFGPRQINALARATANTKDEENSLKASQNSIRSVHNPQQRIIFKKYIDTIDKATRNLIKTKDDAYKKYRDEVEAEEMGEIDGSPFMGLSR